MLRDYPGAIHDDLEGGRLTSETVESRQGSSGLCTYYRLTHGPSQQNFARGLKQPNLFQ